MRPPCRALLAALAALACGELAMALPVAPESRVLPGQGLDFDWADSDLAWAGCSPPRAGTLARPPSLQSLSLEAALALAACRSSGVRRGLARERQAEGELAQAKAAGLPGLSLSTGADAERGSSLGWSSSVNLAWVLFDFGRQRAQSQQALQGLEAVRAERQLEFLGLMGDTVNRYAAAEAAFGRWEAARVAERLAVETVQVARARQGEGASAMSDVVQAQALLAQARVEQLRARGQWVSARGALAVAMGLAPTTPIVLAPAPLAEGAQLPSGEADDMVIQEAQAQHPRVKAAQARLDQAHAQADAAHAERWGRVVVNASGGRSRPTYGQEATATGSAQIAWNLPLLDGGHHLARQQAAQAGVALARAVLEESRREVSLAAWQQAQAVASEAEVLRTSLQALRSAQLALEAATERYRQGVSRYVELQSAQLALATAHLQRAEAEARLRREQQWHALALGRLAIPDAP